MVRRLPTPQTDAAVRLWVDRRFHVVGAGTVVTGTLPAGRIGVGDELSHGATTLRVRGIESLGQPADAVHGVARVALRLGGGVPDDLRRGSALVTPGQWHLTAVVDIRVNGTTPVPERPLLHIGAVAASARYRPLGDGLGRLSLDRPLPLHVGDRVVLRDPGSRTLWGAVVLDPAPPPLGRRGAARRRAASLAGSTGVPDLADELRRRGAARISELRRIGVPVDDERVASAGLRFRDWLLDKREVPRLERELSALVVERRRSTPLDAALPLAVAAKALGLPAPELVALLVRPPLEVVEGHVVDVHATLPGHLLEALRRLGEDLAAAPFAAPDADRLAELGLGRSAQAAAEKAGLLLRLGDGVVLLPGAAQAAAEALADLPQPFTTSQARVRLGTSRRVVLPLLALLDARRLTRRLPDDRREVVAAAGVTRPAERRTPPGARDPTRRRRERGAGGPLRS